MGLEQIIRPFQSDDPFARYNVAIIAGGYSGVQTVVASFGSETVEPKTLSGSSQVSNTIYQDSKSTITPYKTEVNRVENKDDPDQYVDTERYTSIDQESGKGKNYKRVRAEVDNSKTESADQKVLRRSTSGHWTDFHPDAIEKDEYGQSLLNADGTVRAWSWNEDGSRSYDNGNGTWDRI